MLLQQINPTISKYIRQRMTGGQYTFALCGGRRSGKTFCVMQYLITRAYYGDIINVASMTAEQGRLGAYADATNIISDNKELADTFEIVSVPKEIRSKTNRGKIVFNSYQNPETAKGIACDWLFVNEANNFSKQQYTDLLANVRKGVFIDYNPNKVFWVSDFFAEADICVTTWKNNPYLTTLQLEYFNHLKQQAEHPQASAVEIRNYNIYYLGKYSELRGTIFTEDKFVFIPKPPEKLRNICIYCDPSALCGADYFACVLSATADNGKVVILDVFSTNTGAREVILNVLIKWSVSYDRVMTYVEANGIIGIEFIKYCRKRGYEVQEYFNRDNKQERILSNFENFKDNMLIVEKPLTASFMAQVYDFDIKCEHDDNADALSSSYTLQRFTNGDYY